MVIGSKFSTIGRGKRRRTRHPPQIAVEMKTERQRMRRMAFVRHAMSGEETRKKALVTLPKLKFLET